MNRLILSAFLIGAILKTTQIHALVVKTIDELHPLQVILSDRSFNRIAVENGGIRKIVAPEELFDIQIDEITSQAFISIRESFDQPVAISVITDAGFVQDIEITAEDKPTEMVLLREPKKEEKLVESAPNDSAVKILLSLANGKVPSGYIASLGTDSRLDKACPSLCFTSVQALESPYERIALYYVRNTGSNKIQLKETALAQPEDRWIYLSKESLEPKEQTILIIARGKE